MDPGQWNAALEPLATLVGEWVVELSNASFLPTPSDAVRTQVSIEWAEEGACLAMRTGDRAAGPPWALWLIGRDGADESYTALYFDDRGVSRVYAMSLAGDEWRIWRDDPDFRQRFVGRLSLDGRADAATWEKSVDGCAWEHDFDMTYTRLPG